MKKLLTISILLTGVAVIFFAVGIYYYIKTVETRSEVIGLVLDLEKETILLRAEAAARKKEQARQEAARQAVLAAQTSNSRSDRRTSANAVVFTFDDGPYRDYQPGATIEHTESILDILKAENIKATFFVLGSQFDPEEAGQGGTFQCYQEWLKRMVAEGHTVAVHDYRHVAYRKQSRTELDHSINYTRRRIREVTGQPAASYVRSPGGLLSQETADYLKEKKYPHVYWHLNGELFDDDSNDYLGHLKEAIEEGGRGIILMHDRNASGYLPGLIDFLKEKDIPIISLEKWAATYSLPDTPLEPHTGQF